MVCKLVIWKRICLPRLEKGVVYEKALTKSDRTGEKIEVIKRLIIESYGGRWDRGRGQVEEEKGKKKTS